MASHLNVKQFINQLFLSLLIWFIFSYQKWCNLERLLGQRSCIVFTVVHTSVSCEVRVKYTTSGDTDLTYRPECRVCWRNSCPNEIWPAYHPSDNETQDRDLRLRHKLVRMSLDGTNRGLFKINLVRRLVPNWVRLAPNGPPSWPVGVVNLWHKQFNHIKGNQHKTLFLCIVVL